MFIFSEPLLIGAVIAAHNRGVKVKVMLNPSRSNGAELNQDTRKKLEELGLKFGIPTLPLKYHMKNQW